MQNIELDDLEDTLQWNCFKTSPSPFCKESYMDKKETTLDYLEDL